MILIGIAKIFIGRFKPRKTSYKKLWVKGSILKYRDLSKIKLDPYDLDKNLEIIKQIGVEAPDSVIEQFYLDHNQNSRFLTLYGDLDLNELRWELIELEVSEFYKIGSNASFAEFLAEVSESIFYYEQLGDSVIDCRPKILNHWKLNGTWLVPPILIDCSLLGGVPNMPHLVEGHTRVGCLLGLDKYRIIPIAKKHQVYWGFVTKRHVK